MVRMLLLVVCVLICQEVLGQHLKVVNGKLVDHQGRSVKIVESNSPENRLLWCEKTELDILHSFGVNTIYASLNGDEDNYSNIGPWIDYYKPELGFDEERIAQWKDYFEYWVSLGTPESPKYLHLLLSEQETHFRLSDTQHDLFLRKMVSEFGHLPIIWDREEFPRNQTNWLKGWNALLRELDPNNLIAIHNEPRQEPWEDMRGFELDLVSLQCYPNELVWRMRDAHAFGQGQWAVYASEIMPYWEGNKPGDTQGAIKWYLGDPEISSGAGIFYGLLDQSYPNHLPYQSVYEAITKPDAQLVFDNINQMFWVESEPIFPFITPAYSAGNGALSMLSNEFGTFGYWRTRYPVSNTPNQMQTIRVGVEVESTNIRLRVYELDWGTIWETVVNNGKSPLSVTYRSGKDRVGIALDILDFDLISGGSVRLVEVGRE